MGSALGARAQERPSAALLATTGSGELPAGAPASFDRVLRSELDALARVRVQGSAALRLEDVQLALGCEGETQSCLGAVAREIGVRLLLLPNLDRIGSELVLSVAIYDAEADEAPRRVARRASGDDAQAALVGEVAGLLAEVLGVEDARVEAPDPPAEPLVVDPAPPAERRGGPDDARVASAGVLTFAGVAAAALGIGFGVSTLERASAYERAPTDTVEEAEEAARRLVQAREDALTANVLWVAGGVAGVAGLAWLIAELVAGSSAPSVALVPLVGPDHAALVVVGAWR